MGRRFIVGMKDPASSFEVLRWAIQQARQQASDLIVVHAASLPITVRNGPSRAVAFKMGDPVWATIYGAVKAAAPPAGTVTHVEGGCAADIIAKHAEEGDTIVLGPARKRWFHGRSTEAQLRALGHDVHVVEAVRSGSFVQGSDESAGITPSGQSSAKNQPPVPQGAVSPHAA